MRIAGFDLETTDLGGNFGRILCGVVKPYLHDGLGAAKVFRGDVRPFRQKDIADDGRLAVAIRDELEHYDVIVGHNSKLFDRKFLNARLLRAGERPKASQFHVDTMWVIRTHFRMSSKLDNVQKMLGLPDEKTPIDWNTWARAGAWVRSAMDEVVEHCLADVDVLEGAYWKLLPSIRTIRRD